jgi:hypothetical protein
LRTIQKIRDAVGTLSSGLQRDGTVDAELAENFVKVAEFELVDLCRALGLETNGTREMTRRYAELRAANARVHELETLLGNTQSPETTQAALKNLADRLETWWGKEGFGLVSDVSFGAYSCKVNFSCILYGDFRLIDSPTPVSDKERKRLWHESLRERGFVLVQEGSRDLRIQDCDVSRQALMRLVKTRLPSFKISEFTNHSLQGSSEFALRSVEGYIHNIADIQGLPV